jgi:hypothetical protein
LFGHLLLRQSSTLPEVGKPGMELRSAWTRHPFPFAMQVLFLGGFGVGLLRGLIAGFLDLSADPLFWCPDSCALQQDYRSPAWTL